jgi:integrase
MASTYNRGTRAKPRYYASVKLLDGTWRAYPTHALDKATADRIAAEMQQRADKGLPPVEKKEKRPTVSELAELWMGGLTNRNRDQDRLRVRKYILPEFATLTMPEVTMRAVVHWLDKLRALDGAARISSATQRHIFDLFSRFLSWGVERGHVDGNACRMIPVSSKVRPSRKPERPRTWIQDPELARTILCALPQPYDLIFLIGYTSGLRPGETCGLRLSDCAWLEERDPEARVLRIRYNRLGPLKEDKCTDGAAKVKWALTSDDEIALILAQVERRRAQGAKDEDLLFVSPRGNVLGDARTSEAWTMLTKPKAEGGAGLTLPDGLDFYAATRHTFVSRQLAAGEQLADVSRSIGHADERITKKHYAHVVKTTFPASMRRGLGVAPAPVLPFPSKAAS